jgi:hypothetical protein
MRDLVERFEDIIDGGDVRLIKKVMYRNDEGFSSPFNLP